MKKIGLVYTTDHSPGYTRKRAGKTFIFFNEKNKPIKNKKIIDRIQKLVIPPAWENVWICKNEHGHIQATGRDARKRKQYKYHADWSQARNEVKFHKLSTFGNVLGKLRRRIRKDLARKGMPKDKVVASVLRVMEITHIRVGNELYAKQNHSYGLTTIQNRHVKVVGQDIRFHFKGKSGIVNTSHFEDRRLSKIIKRCQDLPGEELFNYVDEQGRPHQITSDDVNTYIRETTGADLTAKDFRTWAGSCAALEILLEREDAKTLSETAWKKCQTEVAKQTAQALLNTVAVCRKYYIHPEVFEACRRGHLQSAKLPVKARPGLNKCETILMKLVG